MSEPENLLFVLKAIERGLVTADQGKEALAAAMGDSGSDVSELLVERGILTLENRRAILDELGGNANRSAPFLEKGSPSSAGSMVERAAVVRSASDFRHGEDSVIVSEEDGATGVFDAAPSDRGNEAQASDSLVSGGQTYVAEDAASMATGVFSLPAGPEEAPPKDASDDASNQTRVAADFDYQATGVFAPGDNNEVAPAAPDQTYVAPDQDGQATGVFSADSTPGHDEQATGVFSANAPRDTQDGNGFAESQRDADQTRVGQAADPNVTGDFTASEMDFSMGDPSESSADRSPAANDMGATGDFSVGPGVTAYVPSSQVSHPDDQATGDFTQHLKDERDSGNGNAAADVTGVFTQAESAPTPTPPPKRPEPKPTAKATATAAGELESVSKLNGKRRYLLKKEFARGGLGCVWLAHDQHIARDVALKELLPASLKSPVMVERFYEEAQVTGQLEHPGIVPIYELGVKADGSPFYAMKLLGGRTFSDAIKEYHALPADSIDRPMALSRLLNIFVDVCNAMGYAHSRGVLHRDLKPLNVMVGDFGEAIVVDWGLAKVIGAKERPRDPSLDEEEVVVESEPETQPAKGASGSFVRTTMRTEGSRTYAGSIMGTPAYMSPEQAKGQLDQLDARSDNFSLGAILYEILVGKPPFTGKKAMEIIKAVTVGQFEPPRAVKKDVPPALEAVCLKSLSLNREDRYQTATELADDISRWLAGEPVGAYPEPWWITAGRWAKKHRTLVSTVGMSVVVLAIALGAWRYQEGQRIDGLRVEANRLLRQGHAAYGKGDWPAARVELTSALATIGSESALSALRDDADRLLGETNKQIALAEASQKAKADYASFRKLRDDALFHGTLMTGLDFEENRRQTQEAARKALSLYGVKLGSAGEPVVPAEYLNPEEAEEVHEGSRELLLVLAESIAAHLPTTPQAERQAKAAEALPILEQSATHGRPMKAAALRRARYLMQSGDKTAAQAELKKAESITPTSATDYFLVGDEEFQRGDFAAAIRSFDHALRLDPEYFWAQYYQAVSYIQLKRYAEAAAGLTACLSRRPDFVWVYLLRGTAYGQLGEFAASDADFEKAIELDPNLYAIYNNRGLVRMLQDKVDDARSDFERASAINLKQYEAFVNLAETYRRQGKHDQAEKHLQQASELAPHQARPVKLLANLARERGDMATAKSHLQKSMEREPPASPSKADSHIELGKLLHQERNYPAALAEFQAALAIHPDNIDLFLPMATTLTELNRLADALKFFSQYIDRAVSAQASNAGQSSASPETKRLLANAYRDRGLIKAKLGDVSGAFEDYTRALELQPDAAALPREYDRNRFSLMRSRRGWQYLTEASKLAEKDFDAAIAANPRDFDAYNGRGYARVLQGKTAEGTADAEKAVDIAGKDPGALSNAGTIYAQAVGKLKVSSASANQAALADKYEDRAVELLTKCIEMIPPAQRGLFLTRFVLPDTAWDPIRGGEKFKQLVAKYSK